MSSARLNQNETDHFYFLIDIDFVSYVVKNTKT